MSIYKDEIFGPVLSVIRVSSYDQGLELINKYVLIPEVKILGRKNTKRTQRRGRNVWAWVG